MSGTGYSYAEHFGGILITQVVRDGLEIDGGPTVYIQPGDDASQLWEELDLTNEHWTDDDVLSQYFGSAE